MPRTPVPTLEQTLSHILHEADQQKEASEEVSAPSSGSSGLRKLASALREAQVAPLTYSDLHAVKSGAVDPGPALEPAPKLASVGTTNSLRLLAHNLRTAGRELREKRAQVARDLLTAAEALILLRQRRGL